MKKTIIYTLISASLILSSCGASKLESGTKQLRLGMSQQEVISTLGKNYKVMGAVATPDGEMETWSYSDPNIMEEQNKRIIVNIMDGRLVEWYREYIPLPPNKKKNNP